MGDSENLDRSVYDPVSCLVGKTGEEKAQRSWLAVRMPFAWEIGQGHQAIVNAANDEVGGVSGTDDQIIGRSLGDRRRFREANELSPRRQHLRDALFHFLFGQKFAAVRLFDAAANDLTLLQLDLKGSHSAIGEQVWNSNAITLRHFVGAGCLLGGEFKRDCHGLRLAIGLEHVNWHESACWRGGARIAICG